jgi:hypothetical protein
LRLPASQLDDLPETKWAALDPTLQYRQEVSPSGEPLHVMHLGPCGMESLLRVISYIENRTSHGPAAAAGTPLVPLP